MGWGVQFITMTIWLAMAVGFFGYGLTTGKSVEILNTGIPAWTVCLGMFGISLVRWYAARMGAEDAEAKRIAEEARRRQARERDRQRDYDPTFDFNRPDDPQQPN